MHALFRTPRFAASTVPTLSRPSRLYASQSYGNDQSGQAQSDAPNPKADMEHPGPKAPADKASSHQASSEAGQSSSGSQSGGAQSKDAPAQSSSGQKSGGDTGPAPKVHHPSEPNETKTEDVQRHNEEMEQRHDRASNQLSEKDNKVDKEFWTGDVGGATQDPGRDHKGS